MSLWAYGDVYLDAGQEVSVMMVSWNMHEKRRNRLRTSSRISLVWLMALSPTPPLRLNSEEDSSFLYKMSLI